MAQLKFNPVGELRDLEKVAEQLAAASEVTRESRSKSRTWKGMADAIDEAITSTSEPYTSLFVPTGNVDPKPLADAADVLRAVAEALAPQAEMQWSKDELQENAQGVAFFAARGAYEGDDVDRAATALATIETYLSARRNGNRTPATPLATIDGRPDWITGYLLMPDGSEVEMGTWAGNKPTSVSNITAAVRGKLATALPEGTTISDEVSKAIRGHVSTAVGANKNGAAPVTPVAVGDFARLEHSAIDNSNSTLAG